MKLSGGAESRVVSPLLLACRKIGMDEASNPDSTIRSRRRSVEPQPRGYRFDPDSTAIRAMEAARINLIDDGVHSSRSILP
jgi:hypothetical protein